MTCSSTACRWPSRAVGDLVAVPGHRCVLLHDGNNYNGSRRIPVVFASHGDGRTVVRRETWDDLLARDL